jgi:hypothetical protein
VTLFVCSFVDETLPKFVKENAPIPKRKRKNNKREHQHPTKRQHPKVQMQICLLCKMTISLPGPWPPLTKYVVVMLGPWQPWVISIQGNGN